MALSQIDKLEPKQWAIYEVLSEIGPAQDLRILEVLEQKEQATYKGQKFRRRWQINQVTARRNELHKLGLIKCIGQFSGFWYGRKKTYLFWVVQGDYREPAGWVRMPDKPPGEIPNKCKSCSIRQQYNLQQIREQAEKPVLEKLKVHEAGRTLSIYGHQKKEPREQLALF
jgi:hypothetical protein